MKVIKPNEINSQFDGQFYGPTSYLSSTHVHSSGVFTGGSAGIPRLNYKIDTVRTNYIKNSETIPGTGWAGAGHIRKASEQYKGSHFAEFISNSDTWSALYQDVFRANPLANEVLTTTMVLLAGTVDFVSVGVFDDVNGWVGNLPIEILEGPGYYVGTNGAGQIHGLSKTTPTIIKFTTTFNYPSSSLGALFIYPGDSANADIGQSIKVTRVQVEDGYESTEYIKTSDSIVTVKSHKLQAFLVEPERTNYSPRSQNLLDGFWGGSITSELTTDMLYGIVPFYKLTKSSAADWAWGQNLPVTYAAGEELSISIYLLADTIDECSFVLFANDPTFGVGENWATTGKVEEGPGVLFQHDNGLWDVRSLSTTIPTRVVLTRFMIGSGTLVYPRIYPSSAYYARPVGSSIKATAFQLEKGKGTSYIATNGAPATRGSTRFLLPVENKFPDSEFYTNIWTQSGVTIPFGFTMYENNHVLPARRLTSTAGPSQPHVLSSIVSIPPSSNGGNYCSVYAIAGTSSFLTMSSGQGAVQFDLTNRTMLVIDGTAVDSYGIEQYDLLSGWVKCWVKFTGTLFNVGLWISETSGVLDYVGTGKYLDIIGYVISSELGAYVPTLNSTVPIQNPNCLLYCSPNSNQQKGSDGILYQPWSPIASYSLGNNVGYKTRRYEALGAIPAGTIPSQSTLWLDLGSDNRHALFDTSFSSSSVGDPALDNGLITFVLKVGEFDSLALMNVYGAGISIGITDADTGKVLYADTHKLSDERTQVVIQDIPTDYNNCLLAVEVIGDSEGVASIGTLVAGNLKILGTTPYGASAGIVDYSRKDVNEFGESILVKRKFSKKMTASVDVKTEDINSVQNYLYSMRATPSVWIGSDIEDYQEPLAVFGFYKDFSNVISYPTHSVCNIEIEGLA